jgi:hypothetical protein
MSHTRDTLDPEILDEILDLDVKIQASEDYDDFFEDMVFRRDILVAEYPTTAAFRDLTINDLMRKKT